MKRWHSEHFLAAQPIHSIALSFDTKKLFAITQEALYCFNPQSGKALFTHKLKTKPLNFSLVAGDGWLATVLEQGAITIFSEKLQQISTIQLENASWIDLYQASPDGESFYCNPGYPNYAVKRIHLKTQKEEWSHEGYCSRLAIAKDKVFFDPGEKLFFFVKDKEKKAPKLTREKSSELGLSSDGNLLGYVGAYSIAHIRNLQTNKELKLQMFWGGICNILFSPDQSRLLVSSNEGDYGCFDTKTGRTLYRFQHKSHGKPPIIFTDDALYIVAGHRIERYNAHTGERLDAHQICSPVKQLCYSEGSLFASFKDQNFDKQVLQVSSSGQITSAHHGTQISSQKGHVFIAGSQGKLISKDKTKILFDHIAGRDGCLFAALSPDTKQVVIRDSHWPSEIRAYSGNLPSVLEKDSYPKPCSGAFSLDGTLFALIGKKPGIQLYETCSWQIKDSITSDKLRFLSLAFHPTKKQVAALAVTGELSLINYEDHKLLWSIVLSKKKPTRDHSPQFAFSPDGSLLFVVGLESKLQVFSTKDGKKKEEKTLPAEATALTAGDDGMLYLGLQDCSLVGIPDLFMGIPTLEKKAANIFARFDTLTVENCEATLTRADWSTFVPERDLLPLRALLFSLEQQRGITELHQICTAKLQSLGARVVHANAHHTGPIFYALSHSGQYIAVGSWVGDDYERGGDLSLWEVATGRCVNAVPIDGGVGWPDFKRCIKWSPDDSRVGMSFSTNAVGSLEPFDPSGTWCGYSHATNGWDRPPAWAWSPDSKQVFIACWGESATLPGCTLPIDQGNIQEKFVHWMAGPSAQNTENAEGIEPYADVYWLPNGTIVGHNAQYYGSGVFYAIDINKRELLWKTSIDKPIAISLENERFAFCDSGLELHHLTTGALDKSVKKVEATDLAFTKNGHLAVIIEEENPHDKKKTKPSVSIYQQGKLLYTIATTPLRKPFNFVDASSWVWSPDGERGAVLTPDRVVEVYSLAKKSAKQLASFQVDQYVNGLLWGASDVIIAVSSEVLQFWDASGKLIAHHPFAAEADSLRPLLLQDKDLGERFTQNPQFPVKVQDKSAWAVAFENGLVACPMEAHPLLDTLLCFVIERYSWPYRWSSIPPRESVAELLPLPECPIPRANKDALLKILLKGAKKEVFPPKKKVTLAELIELYLDSIKTLHSGWDTHISEQKKQLAKLFAITGKIEEAKKILAEIPKSYRYQALVAAAEISIHFAKEKKTTSTGSLQRQKLAKEFLALAKQDAGAMSEWNQTWVHGSLGGAKFLLGDKKAAEKHFEEAQKTLAKESNPFQLYAALASIFLEIGEVKRAFNTIAKGPFSTYVPSFLMQFMKRVLSAGHINEAEQLLNKIEKHNPRLSELDLLYAFEETLTQKGELERLFSCILRFEGIYIAPYLSKVLVALYASKKAAALKLWKEQLEKSKQWPDSFSYWVELGARLDAKLCKGYIDELYKNREALYKKSANQSDFLQNLTKALLQTKREKEASSLLPLAKTEQEKFILGALLSQTKDKAAKKVLEEAPREVAESRENIRLLAKTAYQAKDQKRYLELIEKLHQTGTDWDRRWSAEEAVRLQIELGDWLGLHESLQKIPPSRRTTPLKEAAKGAAKAGLLAESAFFLQKLPSTDLNDRPNAAFDVISVVASREFPGFSLSER